MKLQPASEMLKVAENNFEKLKATALGSSDYKNLVQGIEKQAEKGLREYTYRNNSNQQFISIFKTLLQENGYEISQHISGFGLTIKW